MCQTRQVPSQTSSVWIFNRRVHAVQKLPLGISPDRAWRCGAGASGAEGDGRYGSEGNGATERPPQIQMTQVGAHLRHRGWKLINLRFTQRSHCS